MARIAGCLFVCAACFLVACASSAPPSGGPDARLSSDGAAGVDGSVDAATWDANAAVDGEHVSDGAISADGPSGTGTMADSASSLDGPGTPDGPDTSAGFDAQAEGGGLVDPLAEAMHARADRALADLMLNFWPSLRANTTTYDWMYAHYWDAVLDAADRRGPNAYAGTVRMFYDLQAQRGWLDGFYDDENWITLTLLHAHKVTGESLYLDQAKVVFADIMKAWDVTCCGANPGGLFWKKPNVNKVTAINAGAVISGSRLYEATGDATYLAFAQKAFDYWSTYMVDGATGHVYDGMDNAGVIQKTWTFTYNEGLFIGAVVELARATKDMSHVPLAHKVAGFMMQKESIATAAGTILSDGKCSGDGQMFKGIGARYLGELYVLDPTHTEYRDFMVRSADAAWTKARDPATGKISCDWAGPYDAATGLVGSLGSAAVGLAAAAEALGPGTQRPALQYEAEEGNLHGVLLEANYLGFSGWGYVAGWGTSGQSVDLLVDVPAAGPYRIDFRYATGAMATRAIAVNGVTVVPSQVFPTTGGYATYASVSVAATLAAGRNTVNVALSAAQASGGFVNLDRALLTKQ